MSSFIGKGAVLGLGLILALAFAAPVLSADQSDLEAKIKQMEQALKEVKGELAEVKGQKTSDAKLPSWAQRMTFYGDIRFRYEHTSKDDFKGKKGSDKDRWRTRFRFGVKSQIHQDVELGFRLATGADGNPTSTNQTNGNYWAEFSKFGVDRAYLKWTPSFAQKMMWLGMGKMKNPWKVTKAIYDGDVVPEGIWLGGMFNKKGAVQPYATLGWHWINQTGEFDENVYGYAGQVGVKGKAGKFKYDVATAYTSWGDFGEAGKYNADLVQGNPEYTENGEDRLSKFRVWDIYLSTSYKFTKKGSVGFYGQYLVNTDAEGPDKDQDTGWLAGLKFKYQKWGAGLWYKYIEGNSTPGFISDSDSGFTNREGWVVGVAYKPWKHANLKLTYFDMKTIEEDISNANAPYQTLFLDLIFKF